MPTGALTQDLTPGRLVATTSAQEHLANTLSALAATDPAPFLAVFRKYAKADEPEIRDTGRLRPRPSKGIPKN